MGSQVGCEVEAAFSGHHHVEDDDVEGEAIEETARFRRGSCYGHAMPVLHKIAGQQRAEAAVVIDNQHVGGVVFGRNQIRRSPGISSIAS